MKAFYPAFCAFAGICMLLTIGSCKKENNQPQYAIPANLQIVSSGYAIGAATKVEIYAASTLFVGYNELYIALYDSVNNKRVTQSQISLSTTLKTASDLNQSGPVENPVGLNANNGLFNAAVIFVSPTAGSGSWTLQAQIQNTTAGTTGNFSSLVNVVQPSPAKSYSVITRDDSASLFIGLVQPANPQPGTNDFEIVIYRQTNAMCFAPDSSYTVSLYANMLAMSGMNAPGNVNPIYTASGHYLGKVNFVMEGAWQVDVNLMHNGQVADTSHYFAMNLQ